MKKLIFGISLMFSGIVLIGLAMISGAVMAVAEQGTWPSVFDSGSTTVCVTFGAIIAIVGLVISALEVFGNNTKS